MVLVVRSIVDRSAGGEGRRMRRTSIISIGGLSALLALAGCGSSNRIEVPTAAFETATYNTLAGRFDQDAAAVALHDAYPDAEQDAFVTALQIADAACLVAHYELTADGRSAVYALRQTDHGEDVMAVALRAGCANGDNAAAFVAAIPTTQ